MKRFFRKDIVWGILRHGFIPVAVYLSLFCLLTWPLTRDFSTHFFTDDGDGFMNIWNLWWVNTAVTQPSIHPSIWHTDMLHWPFGTTLLGQTLNPFNGLLAVPLLRVMQMRQRGIKKADALQDIRSLTTGYQSLVHWLYPYLVMNFSMRCRASSILLYSVA